MEKKGYRRLVVSDLHLGSYFSREDSIYEMLQQEEFDEIILAGDIIDFIKVPMFTDKTAKIIQILSEKKAKIVYVVGNHDVSFKKFSGQQINGVWFTETYDFVDSGRRFRVEHGDKYENGVIHNRPLMALISLLANTLERWFRYDLTAWWEKIRNKKRKLVRIWDIVKWNQDADVFIMGHTHIPEVLIWVDKNEEIKTYVNTGDWVQHGTYATIENGVIRLRNHLKKLET